MWPWAALLSAVLAAALVGDRWLFSQPVQMNPFWGNIAECRPDAIGECGSSRFIWYSHNHKQERRFVPYFVFKRQVVFDESHQNQLHGNGVHPSISADLFEMLSQILLVYMKSETSRAIFTWENSCAVRALACPSRKFAMRLIMRALRTADMNSSIHAHVQSRCLPGVFDLERKSGAALPPAPAQWRTWDNLSNSEPRPMLGDQGFAGELVGFSRSLSLPCSVVQGGQQKGRAHSTENDLDFSPPEQTFGSHRHPLLGYQSLSSHAARRRHVVRLGEWARHSAGCHPLALAILRIRPVPPVCYVDGHFLGLGRLRVPLGVLAVSLRVGAVLAGFRWRDQFALELVPKVRQRSIQAQLLRLQGG